MKAVSDLFPRLLPYLPGCSELLARQAVVDAAIQFCEESTAVRYNLDAFNTGAGESAYDLEGPSQQRVGRVLSVKIDGVKIDPATPAVIEGRTEVDERRPVNYSVEFDGDQPVLTLYPTPDRAYVVDVYASMVPLRNATQLDDSLLTVWTEGVVAGAMARIRAVPNQPFTDLASSEPLATAAGSLARKARAEADRGKSTASVRVRMNPAARGRK